jgi:hypothetical protein
MNQNRVTAVLTALGLAIVYALLRAGGAGPLELALVACAASAAGWAGLQVAWFNPSEPKGGCK